MKSSIILIDKPAGMTSFSAVSRVRRLFGAKKAGHCGTLDPDATGLLPVMLGNAVKATPYLTDHDKDYTASLRLGI
ncbi:MAG TPA: tRNA pseudouridine(55) synthase TruB, partial [Bacillota bacterium]|nr:tRNA pseudouridine(55) synthase TruB [Bacillota bacterium]